MKNINEIIASLNVARSNDCSKEKSEEFKSIIKELLPYGEIEQEIGINLRVLFKALKDGVWSNHYAYLGEEIHKIDVDFEKSGNGFYISGGFGEGHKFEDYGKTWALTKEELL